MNAETVFIFFPYSAHVLAVAGLVLKNHPNPLKKINIVLKDTSWDLVLKNLILIYLIS